MSDTFLAVDVETANPNLASICQIGVVVFQGGRVASRWSRLVNPRDEFHPVNVAIHGITEETVVSAPEFPAVVPDLWALLGKQTVVSHTWFDRVALQRAAERYGTALPPCRWFDSAKVVRRTWVQFAQAGFGLPNIAASLGITYRAHDAVEDARAAGEVVLRAFGQSASTFADWCDQIERPLPSSVALEGNLDGPLYGHVIVFTGALSLPRREASALAASAGCTVATGVNKLTTLLVVGDQDIRRLNGDEKSNKQQRAEELIAKGHAIRILTESDFRRVVLPLAGNDRGVVA